MSENGNKFKILWEIESANWYIIETFPLDQRDFFQAYESGVKLERDILKKINDP